MGTKQPWFQRFAEIPGIEYSPPKEVNRKHPYCGLSPERSPDSDMLWWTYPDEEGTTSVWPANRYFEKHPKAPITQMIWTLYESLELPGDLSCYHFLIQGVCEGLWNKRSTEPNGLRYLEYFCYLDLRLNELYPTIHHSGDVVLRILTVDFLLRLYLAEGAWGSALQIAERSERLGLHIAPTYEEIKRKSSLTLQGATWKQS